MGGRYYVTGVQLGMLAAYLDLKQIDKVTKLLVGIEDKQYLCGADSDHWQHLLRALKIKD